MSKRLDHARANRNRVERDVAPSTTLRWWLTPARKASHCDNCAEKIAVGEPYAFRAADKRSICAVCVDRLALQVTESRRLRESRREPAGKRTKPRAQRQSRVVVKTRDQALAKPCPVCSAEPGQPCYMAAKRTHLERY